MNLKTLDQKLDAVASEKFPRAARILRWFETPTAWLWLAALLALAAVVQWGCS